MKITDTHDTAARHFDYLDEHDAADDRVLTRRRTTAVLEPERSAELDADRDADLTRFAALGARAPRPVYPRITRRSA
ncbi:hypothetical protein ACXET9_13190 [Brachybacterium sp. DNPG3]